MLRTWFFFTFGGFFTACHSNALRKFPIMRKPQLHLACTSVGCVLGYMFHNFEEGSEERIQRLLEKHQQAPKQWAEFVK